MLLNWLFVCCLVRRLLDTLTDATVGVISIALFYQVFDTMLKMLLRKFKSNLRKMKGL